MAREKDAEVRLGITALEDRIGYARSTISKWVLLGTFPRPHYVEGRRRWWLADVQEWEARVAGPAKFGGRR